MFGFSRFPQILLLQVSMEMALMMDLTDDTHQYIVVHQATLRNRVCLVLVSMILREKNWWLYSPIFTDSRYKQNSKEKWNTLILKVTMFVRFQMHWLCSQLMWLSLLIWRVAWCKLLSFDPPQMTNALIAIMIINAFTADVVKSTDGGLLDINCLVLIILAMIWQMPWSW